MEQHLLLQTYQNVLYNMIAYYNKLHLVITQRYFVYFRIFQQPSEPKHHQTGLFSKHFLPEYLLVSFTSSWRACPIPWPGPHRLRPVRTPWMHVPAFKSLWRRWKPPWQKSPRFNSIVHETHLILYIYLNILSYHGFVCCVAINLANNLAIILWTLVSLLSWPTCSIGKVTKKLSFFKLRLTTRVQVRLFITFPNHSAKLGKPSSFLHKCCQKDLTKGCCKLQRW